MALDGNAIGGLLLEIFATDMTSAEATCAACGAVRPLAETTVYLRAPGTVVRCRRCTSVLMVVARARGVNCVDLSGMEALEVKAARHSYPSPEGEPHEHELARGHAPADGRSHD